jgi:hypothetical protein
VSASLAERFLRFADQECDSSPLYQRLSRGIAADGELSALADDCPPGQPAPNLLLASVHYLLLSAHRNHPLAAFYPSLAPGEPASGDPFPLFRAFCLEHAAALRALLTERRVQTNEVRRSACLLPAFLLAAHLAGSRPLALIELGASAGFNLLWDRYAYRYGDGPRLGPPDALLELACQIRGSRRLPPAGSWPVVASRTGVDLNPVNIHDDDAVLWLQALIWPENTHRAECLRLAVEAARTERPAVLAGNALALLPGLLQAAPAEAGICVFHSFALYQFSPAQRAELAGRLAHYAAGRPCLFWIGLEWMGGPQPLLSLASFTNGVKVDKILAACHPHGEWIEWRQPGATT